jgi:acetyl esterase/lipase
MAYIRQNAKELNVDEDMVASVGFSAGGHLCAMLGSISDAKEVTQIFKPEVCTKPNAVILAYPVIMYGGKGHFESFNNLCGDDVELKKRVDVVNLVNKNSAPAFIWATFDDGVVPVQNSLAVASAYERECVKFSIHVWGTGAHGLSVANKDVYSVEMQKSLLNPSSKSVHKWLDLAQEWLEEVGVKIED